MLIVRSQISTNIGANFHLMKQNVFLKTSEARNTHRLAVFSF